MQYFLEAYTVLRFNMHLGSLDHAFLNKTACLTHGLLKFHAIHSIRSDNGGKQISGSTAFLKNIKSACLNMRIDILTDISESIRWLLYAPPFKTCKISELLAAVAPSRCKLSG